MNHTPAAAGTILGHPRGLFVLFFAEMWERFSFYGMRALLVLYMIKGFLGYGDSDAYTVYGAYTALVYMTPFFGGMLADRLLGRRRAVVLGGLLMSAGHLTMTWENKYAFFTALALLIAGNGFFKPNISTMVGELYAPGSRKRDSGFTIFYMGINLGAAAAPLLCGYVGEKYGWHYGFGLATIGMLTGLAVFVMPTLLTQVLIFLGAGGAAVGLFYNHADNVFSIGLNVFVAIAMLTAATVALTALSRGVELDEVGRPPDAALLRRRVAGMPLEALVYLLVLAAVPVFALLVSGFAPFTADHKSVTVIPDSIIQPLKEGGGKFQLIAATVLTEVSKPAGLLLMLAGVLAFIYLTAQLFRLEKIARERMLVALILTFFSMLFWAFFEQAGSSINNFTDRNVDRVVDERTIAPDEVGKTIRVQPTQEQLGYRNGDRMFTLTQLDTLRQAHLDAARSGGNGGEGSAAQAATAELEIDWTVAPDNVGMVVSSAKAEIPASTFQAVNAVFILVFGLVFTALWSFLGKRNLEPSTPLKFAFGLLQLGLGFGAFWYGAQHADQRGMVLLIWLILGYLLHTTGELCLSPVGLSMITKLSPAQLVSTMMGTWFLATAFSQYLAAIIAQFTGIGHGTEGGDAAGIPVPLETVHVYGDVFGQIAIAGMISGVICLVLVPLLKRWMHEDQASASASGAGH